MTPGTSSARGLMESPPGPTTVFDGRRYLYFAGTGYLGLQDNPEIIEALCEGARKYGINSATSRATLGNTPPVLEAECLAATFFDREDAFYYATGYAGNFILASTLAERVDAVFVDERAYYCLREAAPLVRGPVHSFRHADPADLRNCLRRHLKPAQRPLVMSDGVFGVTGEIAPVADYVALLTDYPAATLLLDDAHGVGVLGEDGRGTFEHANLYDRVNTDDAADPSHGGPRLMFSATLSKAIGGYGGIIPGSRNFTERAKTASRWFDCASAPPVPIAAATARALQIVMAHPELRSRLRENVGLLRRGLRQMGLAIAESPVPFIYLRIGSSENMQRIQTELRARGILILYRGGETVGESVGRLRMAVFATHTEAMIGQFLEVFRTLI